MVLDARLQSAQVSAMQEMEEAASNPRGQVPLHELASICKGCGNARIDLDKICPQCGCRHDSIVEDFQKNLEITRQRAREDAEKQYNKAMKKYEKSVKQRATNPEPSEGFWGMVSRAGFLQKLQLRKYKSHCKDI